jgi:hypothetical protein
VLIGARPWTRQPLALIEVVTVGCTQKQGGLRGDQESLGSALAMTARSSRSPKHCHCAKIAPVIDRSKYRSKHMGIM